MIEVSDNDVQYYERKVMRLEQDIALLQEELNRVRGRLRNAEDFEIKYRILLKNAEVDIERARIEAGKVEEVRGRERLAEALRENDERWAGVRVSGEEALRREWAEEVRGVRAELEEARAKAADLSRRREEMELFGFKTRKYEKENEALSLQLATMQALCERQKAEEMAALRSHLTAAFKERIAAERQSYESKLVSLSKQLAVSHLDQDLSMQFPELSNAELTALRGLFAETVSSHEKEVSEFQEIILRKNAEIKALHRELSERQGQFEQILKEQHNLCSSLQEEVTRLRKENEQEVLLLTSRLSATHLASNDLLKEQVRNMTEFCRGKENELSRQSQAHREELQAERDRLNEEVLRMAEQRGRLEGEQQEARRRVREGEERVTELTLQLHLTQSKSSNCTAPQDGEYSSGVAFLERQLRRAEQRSEEKTRLYSRLETDMQSYQRECEAQFSRLGQQLRVERKEGSDKIASLQNQVRDLMDKLLTKDKQMTRFKQSVISSKLESQASIRALRGELEELQDDYSRANQTRIKLEEVRHTQKGYQGHGHQSLQKQANPLIDQLEAVYRQKEEALRRREEQYKESSAEELKRLRRRVEELTSEIASLKRGQQRGERSGRGQEERKLAAIDLELGLMSNIYHELIHCSARQAHPSEQPLQQ